MAVGRISGPLLKANLLRNGVDLAFENDLLYLDVNNLRVGIKTNNPSHDLHVNGTTRTTTLEATQQLDIGNITMSGTTITSNASQLNLTATGGLDPVVYQKKIVVDNIDIVNNAISINTLDTDLELSANGTGQVKIFSNTLINGNLHATGTITADGNIIIGDSNTDNINFKADIASNILPDQTLFYNLGNTDKRWKDVWANTTYTQNLNITGSLVLDGVDLALRPGNVLFVSTNGNDTFTGTHQNDPFRTVKHALSVATAGTTVYIYPGTYSEVFPLTVPVGVNVKGGGLRAVTIQPTAGTISQDAFLLNGETTVEDLTVKGFRFNSGANTGYAFKFAPGFRVTTRSPYVRNASVITEGSVTSVSDPRGFNQGDAGKGAYLDGSIANALSKEASMLFHSVTFITPGVDCITATNGVRIEWLNSFTYFANRGLYGVSGSTGFAGAGKTEVRLESITGTVTAGQTLTYYSTFPTVLGTGVVSSIASDGKIFLTGKVTGLQTAQERGGKTIQAFGGAKISTAVKKWGTGSLQLTNATSDYAFVSSDADFGFGTGNFTIEAWVNFISYPTPALITDFRTVTSQAVPALGVLTDGSPYYYVNGAIVIQGAVGSVTTGNWHHIAVSKVGTNTRLFLNGNQVGSTWTDNTNYIAAPIHIGANFGHTSFANGYIDDLRISKGIGRYTTNFSAPLSSSTNDTYAKLLARFNGTNGSTTFVDETFLVQDIRFSGGATASKITLVDHSDYGVEVRSIASASVYGNYGAVGDGLGVIMYLIGQNFAYIGAGLRSDNDNTYVIQANETVESNGAHIYYSSVDHKGDFRVGDLFYVNQADGTVTFTSANFNVTSTEGLTFTNGGNVTYIDGNEIDTGNLKLSGNTLESTSGPVNILAANDQINLLNNVSIAGNLDVVGNVTIGGNIIIGDQTTDTINFVAGIDSNLVPNLNNTYDIGTDLLRWKDLYATRVFAGNITIANNQVTTTTTNTNLELAAAGTGYVALEGILVQDNEIRTTANADLVLAPNGTGIVDISSTKSLKVPVGTELERPSVQQTGMIRFNTTASRYEGWNGTNWVYLDGLSDLDGNTKITAELTPGANDNTIRFYTDGTQVADINATRFNVIKATVDNIDIDGTTIANNVGGNLSLQASGTGSVILENFAVNGSSITNTVNNAVTTINAVGVDAYVRLVGQGGVVFPAGPGSARPGSPVTGMTRFDTTLGRMEVYDGTTWISVAGAATGISKVEASDMALEFALMLG